MNFTRAALECIEETGIDYRDDLDELLVGTHTRETLLACCLASYSRPSRDRGWRDYVAAVGDEADRVKNTWRSK